MKSIHIIIVLGLLGLSGCAHQTKIKVEMLDPGTIHLNPTYYKNGITDEKIEDPTPQKANLVLIGDAKADNMWHQRTISAVEGSRVVLRNFQAMFAAIREEFTPQLFDSFIRLYLPAYDVEKNAGLRRADTLLMTGNEIVNDIGSTGCDKKKQTEINYRVVSFSWQVQDFLAEQKRRWPEITKETLGRLEKERTEAIKERDKQKAIMDEYEMDEKWADSRYCAAEAKYNNIIRESEDISRQISRVKDVLSRIRIFSESATVAADYAGVVVRQGSNFGGFASDGVYRIAPGDPYYAAMLSAKTIGEPITSVSATVQGKSYVIFVQEAPTYMRVHYVDMNADKMVERVADISGKVLAAWAKYMSGNVSP